MVVGCGELVDTSVLLAIAKLTMTRADAGSPCAHCNFNRLTSRGFNGDGTVKKVTCNLQGNCRVGTSGPTSCATVSSLAFLFSTKVALRGTGFGSNGMGAGTGGSDFSCLTVRFHL